MTDTRGSGVARLVPLGGHLTALIECLTVLLEYIDLISVDMTYSTQSWTGTCPSRPTLGYATDPRSLGIVVKMRAHQKSLKRNIT